MRMTIGGLLAAAILGGATAATAQLHPNGYAGTASSGRLYFFSPQGVATSMSIGSSTGYGLVMGPQNRELYAVGSGGAILRVDPLAQVILGTLATVSGANDLAVDCDGDVFVTTSTSVMNVDPFGAVTTVVTGQAGLNGGMTIDPRTGALIVQSSSGTDPLLSIARDGSSVTTLGTGLDARYGIDIHIPTGAVFSGSCCGDQTPPENVFVLNANQSVATVFLSTPAPPVGVYSLKVDRASAATQQLVLGSFAPSSAARGPGGIYHVDVGSKIVTTFSTLASGASLYETEILYRRNVHTYATARGQWTIGVKVPEDAGKVYQIAISATDIRPGVPVPGQRTAYLTPDTFTMLSFQNLLAPFATGLQGTLDGLGEAKGAINLASLGSVINGLRLYMLVLTFDPQAPAGIRTITDPTVLVVSGV